MINLTGLQRVTQTIGGSIGKNSPTILTVLGATGVITTLGMGIRATPKALSILEEIEDSKYEAARKLNPDVDINDIFLTKKEILKGTWKCYVPTAMMAAATIGCIIGANTISLRRTSALASAYSLTNKAFKEYQEKVVENIGKSKEREVRQEINRSKLEKDPYTKHMIVEGSGDTLCYDAISGRYFWSSKENIREAVSKVSIRMMTDMWSPLNDIYSELDIPGTKAGDILGWYIDDGHIEVSFDAHLADDGRPCLVVDFITEPRAKDINY